MSSVYFKKLHGNIITGQRRLLNVESIASKSQNPMLSSSVLLVMKSTIYQHFSPNTWTNSMCIPGSVLVKVTGFRHTASPQDLLAVQSSLLPWGEDGSAANCLKVSRSTFRKALWSVASRLTLGTPFLLILPSLYASKASNHLDVHKHHLQPSVNPTIRRSFPCDAEYVRNSSDTMPATAWLPISAAPDRQ